LETVKANNDQSIFKLSQMKFPPFKTKHFWGTIVLFVFINIYSCSAQNTYKDTSTISNHATITADSLVFKIVLDGIGGTVAPRNKEADMLLSYIEANRNMNRNRMTVMLSTLKAYQDSLSSSQLFRLKKEIHFANDSFKLSYIDTLISRKNLSFSDYKTLFAEDTPLAFIALDDYIYTHSPISMIRMLCVEKIRRKADEISNAVPNAEFTRENIDELILWPILRQENATYNKWHTVMEQIRKLIAK